MKEHGAVPMPHLKDAREQIGVEVDAFQRFGDRFRKDSGDSARLTRLMRSNTVPEELKRLLEEDIRVCSFLDHTTGASDGIGRTAATHIS
jgi:hypothetical protein